MSESTPPQAVMATNGAHHVHTQCAQRLGAPSAWMQRALGIILCNMPVAVYALAMHTGLRASRGLARPPRNSFQLYSFHAPEVPCSVLRGRASRATTYVLPYVA